MKIWKVEEIIGLDMLRERLNDIENMGGKIFQIIYLETTEKFEIYRLVWTLE